MYLRIYQDVAKAARWFYICGFNIAILIGVFMAVSRPLLGARRSVYIALVGIAIYTLLVGAGASVVRAAIMSGLALIGQRLGRRAWRPPLGPH